MRRTLYFILSLAVAMSLLLSACGQTAAPTEAAAPAQLNQRLNRLKPSSQLPPLQPRQQPRAATKSPSSGLSVWGLGDAQNSLIRKRPLSKNSMTPILTSTWNSRSFLPAVRPARY